MQMLGDQGFSLAMVQHLFFSFHVRMMMAITRREDRLQIEQEGGVGRKGGREGRREEGREEVANIDEIFDRERCITRYYCHSLRTLNDSLLGVGEGGGDVVVVVVFFS